MPNTISINDIFAKAIVGASEDDDDLIEFTEDNPPEISEKFWGMVLALSIQDHASSVHYHPWQSERKLTYIVNTVEYEMIPPPDFIAKSLIDFILSHFLQTNSKFLRRLTNKLWPTPTKCTTITFVWEGVAVTWEVIAWATTERSGVDFYRVTPINRPANSESLPAAADAVIGES